MKTQPLIVERTYDAPITRVWEAITNNEQMKKWYFDIESFKPEVGFRFQFYGSKDDLRYLHLCEVTEVVPGKKIAYTWRYADHPGNSTVSFELIAEGGKTRLVLTHTGLESFPSAADGNFAVGSFTQGWNAILGKSLKAFVEKAD
jgi:uncharacterized protein YndB with AHSA1/START domain